MMPPTDQATAPNEVSSKRSVPIMVAVLLGAALIPFLNSLDGEFVSDDYPLVVEHPLTGDLSDWLLVFTKGHYAGAGGYRPLVTLSFALNRAAGGLEPFTFHLTNLAFHALNAVLVFLVLGRLRSGRKVAFAAGLLFAVHPVHTEAVSWISGRAELMAAFFFLLAWWIYLLAAAAEQRSLRMTLWTGSLLSFFAALLCKENALLFPVVMAAGECFRLRASPERAGGPWLGPYAKRMAVTLPAYFMVVGCYFATRSMLYSEDILRKASNIKLLDNPLVTAEFMPRMLTAITVLGDYVWLAVFPFQLSADYSYNEVPIVASMTNMRVAVSVLILAALGVLVMRSWRKGTWTWFAVGFFFFMLASVANIATVIGSIKADRFLYLPIFGLCAWGGHLLFSAPLPRHWGISPAQRTTGAGILLGIVVLVFAGMTWARNPVWRDHLSLWARTAQDASNSAKAHYNHGAYSLEAGDEKTAVRALQRALEIYPGFSKAWLNLGAIHLALGNFNAAESAFRGGLIQDQANGGLHLNLGVLLAGKGDLKGALIHLDRAAELNPENAIAHYNAGLARAKLEHWDEARVSYLWAIRLNNRYLEAHNSLAVLDMKTGRPERARRRLNYVLSIDPAYRPARENLAYLDKLESSP